MEKEAVEGVAGGGVGNGGGSYGIHRANGERWSFCQHQHSVIRLNR